MIVIEYPKRLASLVRDRTGPLVKVCAAANGAVYARNVVLELYLRRLPRM